MAKGWSFGALIAALKGAAFLNVGTIANTVAAGDDWRITGAAQKGNNLADLTDYAKARNQLSAAYVYGDANVDFYCRNNGNPTAAVNNQRLDSMLQTKAGLSGDSNQTFYCRNSGDDTAAVNNQRLDSRLQTKAGLSGDSNQTFYCRNSGDDTAAVNNQRLDYRLQTKASFNGESNQTFYCRNSGDQTAAANNERLNYMLTFKADVAGNQNTPFNVGGATAGTQAVRLDQFQSGSNGNGAWVKLPGGGQWCRTNITIPAKGSATWNFPLGFVSAPAIFVTVLNGPQSIWPAGAGPNNASFYNDNPTPSNVNLLAMW